MKTIILTWIIATSLASAFIHANGKGFFPVLVQVVDAKSGSPIEGVKVRLEGALKYTETELDPDHQTKVLPDSLGKSIMTNAEGVAVVFYFGGFSETISGKQKTYSRSMDATIIVEHEGKELFRSTLEDWAKKNDYTATSSESAPWIVVAIPPAK